MVSLFLFLGLATSVSATIRRVKVFNNSGKDITVGIDYKTRILKKERMKDMPLKKGKSAVIKPGRFRKIIAIYWNVGGKDYRLETAGIDLKIRFNIGMAGRYSSGKVKGKAKTDSTSYTN